MTHKTQGIVLRAVKYGETSLILSIFTEMFGVSSYIINGVRTEKSGGGKAALYQPGEWLALEVYHAEGRSVNRIREATRLHLFQNNPTDVLKHSTVLFMMELLNKCLKHPERNDALFNFCTSSLIILDESAKNEVTDIALGFALNLANFMGYGIIPPSETENNGGMFFLDLREGSFVSFLPDHPHVMEGNEAIKAAVLLGGPNGWKPDLKIDYPGMFRKINDFYILHNPEFGQMRTLPFLVEMIS